MTTSPEPSAEAPENTAGPHPAGEPGNAQPAAYGYGRPAPQGYGRPGPYGYHQPGPPPPPESTNGLAISSLALSIGGLLLLNCLGIGGLMGIVAAVLGHIARRQIRERDENGDGMAVAGIIIGWIAAGLGLIVFSALGDLAFAP